MCVGDPPGLLRSPAGSPVQSQNGCSYFSTPATLPLAMCFSEIVGAFSRLPWTTRGGGKFLRVQMSKPPEHAGAR